jgi:uncharacterized membrane protein
VAGGFLKTAFRSIFRPGLLFDHIRSTTVTTEPERFMRVCAVFWGLGVAVYRAVTFYRYDRAAYDIDTNAYLIVSVIATLGGAAFAYLMFRLVLLIYHKLVTTEVKQPLPATLTFNIFAYAMGASVLAIIPVVGPLLALIGSFVSLAIAGRRRLFISWRGAIIDALLAFVVGIVATVILYFVGGALLDYLLSAVTPREAGPVLPPP